MTSTPDVQLSLSSAERNGSSLALRNLKNMVQGSNFGYQSFEEDENAFAAGDFRRSDVNDRDNLNTAASTTDLKDVHKDEEKDLPRNRKSMNGKSWINGGAIGATDEDAVEECQIRTYGGPLSKRDLRAGLRACCTVDMLRRRFPISIWLPRYTLADFTHDLVAGLTVGLTVVPQALADAQIVGIPLEYGLYSSFMGPFMYALFGTSSHVTVGPTALLSLLTSAYLPHRHIADMATYAIILSFFSGCFTLLLGILNLGFLVNFVSTPVMSGFTTAASIIIILGQLKNLLGINPGRTSDNIISIIGGYIRHLGDVNGWDVLLGSCCICSILVLKAIAPVLRWDRFRSKQSSCGWRFLGAVLKILCYGRYALVVIIATIIGGSLTHIDGSGPVTITHEVRGGFPPFAAPNFVPDNQTFIEVIDNLGSGLVLIPIIGLFESIVVAKAFSHRFGYTIDSTQELIALGIANIMGSFVSSFPVAGAFSRTALNAESGVRTPLSGIFTGVSVLIAMSILSPVLQYIPKAGLAAVIISAIFVMIDFRIFLDLWRVNRVELIPLCATLLLCLFMGVQFGLPLGIGISLLMLVYPLARPVVSVEYRRTYKREEDSLANSKTKPRFNVTITPQSALYFPSAEFFKDIFAKDLLNPGAFRYGVSAAPDFLYESIAHDEIPVEDRRAANEERPPPIVFNGAHLTNSDYSTVRTMRNIVASCRAARRDIVFTNTSHDFMRLVQVKEDELQMETLSTMKDRPVLRPTSGVDASVSDEKETVSISTPGQIATYSSVSFPNASPAANDLHSSA
ncbi:hypothetical protein RvY_14710 [Ramazzottius varieornatus]|uniref:SLC26A/SulP transporter domain-containing protein n=1 Tax=Ramazzottius varieornatus TaxID=947166 RepID=A0A1D1VSA9_RAMVA|nr:hypothetical protein RvY_14710 [Ramazzottius varieornatus]